jgi:hypothetical protein
VRRRRRRYPLAPACPDCPFGRRADINCDAPPCPGSRPQPIVEMPTLFWESVPYCFSTGRRDYRTQQYHAGSGTSVHTYWLNAVPDRTGPAKHAARPTGQQRVNNATEAIEADRRLRRSGSKPIKRRPGSCMAGASDTHVSSRGAPTTTPPVPGGATVSGAG